jgi:hypothetical protein
MATRKRPEVPEELPMRLIQSRLESMRADPRDVERMVGFLDTVRSGSSGASPHVDRFLVGEYIQMRQGLARAQEAQRELRELHEEMVSPPWYPAIYLGRVGLEGQELAMVYHGGTRRAVAVQETVDREALGVGDEVLLDGDLNLVVGHAPNSAAPAGETALFNRYTSDRRMVLDWHDDEIVVDVADRGPSSSPAATGSVSTVTSGWPWNASSAPRRRSSSWKRHPQTPLLRSAAWRGKSS